MNSREQILKKQVERKDAQIAVLMQAFDNLIVENEVLGSIACAFAWDLADTLSDSFDDPIDPLSKAMIMEWDEAVKAVGG